MYDHDPGGLSVVLIPILIVLVIRRCVNVMEAKWRQLVRSRKMVMKLTFNTSVGCKAEGKSTAVTP